MRQDQALTFCTAQACTAAGTSTDTVDFVNPNPNLGVVPHLKLVLCFPELPAGGTNITFNIQSSDDNSAWATIASTGALTPDQLADGAWVMNPPVRNGRYQRITWTVTGTFTAGTVSAFYAIDPQMDQPYPKFS